MDEQFDSKQSISNLGCPNAYLLLERIDLVLSLHFAELIKVLFSGHPIITAG